MRPTLKQLYNDPRAIIAGLEAAGLENAHAKVMGIMLSVCEYWSMDRHYNRLLRDRTYQLQAEERRLRHKRAKPDPSIATMNQKRASEYHASLIIAGQYLSRTQKRLEAKISKWPEIDVDPEQLRKKPDSKIISWVAKRKMKRRKTARRLFS